MLKIKWTWGVSVGAFKSLYVKVQPVCVAKFASQNLSHASWPSTFSMWKSSRPKKAACYLCSRLSNVAKFSLEQNNFLPMKREKATYDNSVKHANSCSQYHLSAQRKYIVILSGSSHRFQTFEPSHLFFFNLASASTSWFFNLTSTKQDRTRSVRNQHSG